MNPLERMHIFTRVAELASFTQAAQALGLPKASASTAIQQLEAQLGTRLLHRTTRRVQLTQDGQACYERCKDLLAEVDALQSMFQQADGAGLKGRVRIDMSTGMARNVVVPRLPELLRQHPGLALELSSTERRVDVIREGFDCVVRTGAVVDQSLVARPLGMAPLANCASPAYLRRHGTPRALPDLAQHQLVHFVNTLGAPSAGYEAVVDGALVRQPMAWPPAWRAWASSRCRAWAWWTCWHAGNWWRCCRSAPRRPCRSRWCTPTAATCRAACAW